ncbi:GNAT family N-acetyltransferase [Pirellulaceae bacterium SH449]
MSHELNWRGCPIPRAETLTGTYCQLVPMLLQHRDDLFAASMGPGAEERYRFLSVRPQSRTEFEQWFETNRNTKDPLYYSVIDLGSARCGGRQSLMRIDAQNGVIEMGNILWGASIARTRVATEAFYLMAKYVFDGLGYRRLEWKCNAENVASRRAALRFGFTFEGIFRQHMVVKDQNRDTAWFSMLDGEWPAIGAMMQLWLAQENFHSDGTQKARLQDFRIQ